MSLDVDTRWLDTFLAAAELEHFGRAAERLGLSQPAVSAHIAKLEAALGVPLFVRTGRAVRLSPAGRRFRPYAAEALARLSAGAQALDMARQGLTAELTLAVSPLVAATTLPLWVRSFAGEEQHVAFTVRVEESRAIPDLVAEGMVDLGLSREPTELRRLVSRPLLWEPVVLTAPSDAYDLDGPPLSLGELVTRYPLLTHNHPGYWDAVAAAVRRLWPAARLLPVSQVAVTLAWIEEGMGMSFLPWSAVRRAILRGTVLEVPVSELTIPEAATYLVWDPVTADIPACRFAQFLVRYAEDRRGA